MAATSGSSCQAGTGVGEDGGGNWLMTTTGGAGLAASLKILAASSRLSTSFFWPASANTSDPSEAAVVDPSEEDSGIKPRIVEDDGGDCQVDDDVPGKDETLGAEEVMATGAEKLARMPDIDESRL